MTDDAKIAEIVEIVERIALDRMLRDLVNKVALARAEMDGPDYEAFLGEMRDVARAEAPAESEAQGLELETIETRERRLMMVTEWLALIEGYADDATTVVDAITALGLTRAEAEALCQLRDAEKLGQQTH